MIIFISVLLVASTCTALPYAEVDTQNVVTVPPNCPPGQQWINGQCRDVWKAVISAPSNIITVPPNCPPGQQWVNGQCRDVWIRIAREQNKLGPTNAIEAFFNDLRNNLIRKERQVEIPDHLRDEQNRRVVKIPDLVCPDGYRFDNLHNCRKIDDSF